VVPPTTQEPAPPSSGSAAGFALAEVTIAMVLAVVMILALHQMISVSLKARQSADKKFHVSLRSEDYLRKIRQLQFGKASDPPPTATQLSELFDDDEDVGTITLHQLKVLPSSPGHTFSVASPELEGLFRVKVSNDLDGDGSLTGPREGRDDLLRIEIYFDNRRTLDTKRAAEPEFTTKAP
jgi:hypothetical protein